MLEAMRAGRPVVASAVDGVMEDVTDGVNGLLVPPGDAVELARALGSLVADPARRRCLGDQAARTFRDRFAPRAMVEALRATYAEVGFS